MRVFIGLEFSDQVKDELFGIQQECIPYVEKGGFQDSENFHLTIRYLGEVNEMELGNIKQVLNKIAKKTFPFHLTIEGLGTFSKKNHYILWAGLRSHPALTQLHHTTEEMLSLHTSFTTEERAFHPHITFGRKIQFKEKEDVLTKLVTYEPITTLIKTIVLFESARIDGELRYLAIYRASFSE